MMLLIKCSDLQLLWYLMEIFLSQKMQNCDLLVILRWWFGAAASNRQNHSLKVVHWCGYFSHHQLL